MNRCPMIVLPMQDLHALLIKRHHHQATSVCMAQPDGDERKLSRVNSVECDF